MVYLPRPLYASPRLTADRGNERAPDLLRALHGLLSGCPDAVLVPELAARRASCCARSAVVLDVYCQMAEAGAACAEALARGNLSQVRRLLLPRHGSDRRPACSGDCSGTIAASAPSPPPRHTLPRFLYRPTHHTTGADSLPAGVERPWPGGRARAPALDAAGSRPPASGCGSATEAGPATCAQRAAWRLAARGVRAHR